MDAIIGPKDGCELQLLRRVLILIMYTTEVRFLGQDGEETVSSGVEYAEFVLKRMLHVKWSKFMLTKMVSIRSSLKHRRFVPADCIWPESGHLNTRKFEFFNVLFEFLIVGMDLETSKTLKTHKIIRFNNCILDFKKFLPDSVKIVCVCPCLVLMSKG